MKPTTPPLDDLAVFALAMVVVFVFALLLVFLAVRKWEDELKSETDQMFMHAIFGVISEPPQPEEPQHSAFDGALIELTAMMDDREMKGRK
jgi:hypothetical protein